MNKLFLTLPLAAALLAPMAAEARGPCREYSRTIITNGFYRDEYGTMCPNGWGDWDYFPGGYGYQPYAQSVQYYDSPVAYYQQPSTFLSFSFSDNDRRGGNWGRGRDWNNHGNRGRGDWNGHRGGGHGGGGGRDRH